MVSCTQDTGSQGAEGGGSRVWGGQKAESRPTRVQGTDQLGGAGSKKRETRGAIGVPGVR